ncbi:hypothetical protein LM602_06210 [Candidatus Acetothermia bacterium]|jgi:hypothetical protein|nr:hypothetical protein [Candidatus Acetothermia bacterium]MCI2432130.1 hypothetical protein [Candidatus Acetothermia bacterium]MCI2436714.1 hypothetical protein [Candidatus Acetothermia bacterium]
MSRYNYVHSSGLSYKEYLQAQLFVDEVTKATRESGRAVRMEISRQTREIIASREALEQENIRLRESLTEGFETLSYELQDISTGIEELNARFHRNPLLDTPQLAGGRKAEIRRRRIPPLQYPE